MSRTKRLMLKFVIQAALLSVICSCTKDAEITNEKQYSDNGYISFSIDAGMFSGSGVRSSAVEGIDWGRSEENYVEKVRIVLYTPEDGNEPKAEHVFDFNIRTRIVGDADNPEWEGFVEDASVPAGESGKHLYKSDSESRFITFSRKVARKSYRIAAFINPPDALLPITEPGEPISKVTSEWFSVNPYSLKDRDWGGVAEDNYFFMSNLQGIFEIIPGNLMASHEEANENPVNLRVARAVAKVTVEDNIPVVPTGAKAYGFNWQLDVTNQRSYWVRIPAPKITPEGIPGEPEKYEEFESLLSYLKSIYSEDPNFSSLSNYGENAQNVSESDRQDNFNYLIVMHGSENPALPNQPGSYEYCLENTVLPEDQFTDVITSAVIRCNYVPESFYDTESYFLYEGYVIDVETMQGYMDHPETIPQVLKELELTENIVLARANGKLSSSLADLIYPFDAYSIKYYKDGVNYYRIPIEHAQLPTEGMVVEPGKFYGRYGVLRNNHYVIKILSLKGPGSPVLSLEDNTRGSRTAAELRQDIEYHIDVR